MANLCSLNMLNKSGQIVLFLEIFNFKTCQSDSPHILCESHPFCQKGLGWPCQVGQPSKGHPCRILILFSIMFYYTISTTYKKIDQLFCSLIFLDFCTVCMLQSLNCQFPTFADFNLHTKCMSA